MSYFLIYIVSFFGTKFVGLERTILGLQKLGVVLRPLSKNEHLDRVATRLQKAMHRVPLAIKCLDQAISTWYWLNFNGHGAVLRIGVSITPLESHAWVECDGRTFIKATNIPDLKIVAEYVAWNTSSANLASVTSSPSNLENSPGRQP